MSRPPKPFTVLKNEKKSHRTISELKQRQQGEEALATGVALQERSEVKKNKVAHEEYVRLNDLLQTIGKNDAIYETIINRYCLLQGECAELEDRKAEYNKLLKEIRKTFKRLTEDMDTETRALLLIDLTKSLAKITDNILRIDDKIHAKRKMLFDIEKENIMTIAAALRSIPKKEDKAANPLLEALK